MAGIIEGFAAQSNGASHAEYDSGQRSAVGAILPTHPPSAKTVVSKKLTRMPRGLAPTATRIPISSMRSLTDSISASTPVAAKWMPWT